MLHCPHSSIWGAYTFSDQAYNNRFDKRRAKAEEETGARRQTSQTNRTTRRGKKSMDSFCFWVERGRKVLCVQAVSFACGKRHDMNENESGGSEGGEGGEGGEAEVRWMREMEFDLYFCAYYSLLRLSFGYAQKTTATIRRGRILHWNVLNT